MSYKICIIDKYTLITKNQKITWIWFNGCFLQNSLKETAYKSIYPDQEQCEKLTWNRFMLIELPHGYTLIIFK